MGIEKNKEEMLKSLLREAGEEKASFNFTETVLKSIQAELQTQTAGQSPLKSLLQEYAIEQPSANFQVNITEQLSAVPSFKYKPIISSKTWYGIAAMVAVVLVACYFLPSATPAETPGFLSDLGGASIKVLKLTNISRSTLEISMMTLIGLSVLLLTDFFLRQKLSSYNKLARS